MTPLKALRLYQEELASIALEEWRPRLANIADAIGHELNTWEALLAPQTTPQTERDRSREDPK